MQATPQKEHQWLDALVGEWISEIECVMEPGKPAEISHGTERVRSLGGLWIVAEGQGDMPGVGPATSLLTLGYDPQRKRYVGSFIASMMTHQWLYDGGLDAAGRLALDTEGPGMAGDGSTAKYRDVMEVVDRDHRTLTSHMLGDGGQWQVFMTARYRRTK